MGVSLDAISAQHLGLHRKLQYFVSGILVLLFQQTFFVLRFASFEVCPLGSKICGGVHCCCDQVSDKVSM